MTRKSSHLVNALGSVLVPLSALLVAPILSRGLGPTDRGEFAADQALILVCCAIVGLGVSDTASTAWNRWDRRDRLRVTWAALMITAASAVIGTLLTGPDIVRMALVVVGSMIFFLALQARAVGLARRDILGVGLEKIVTSLSRVLLTCAFFFLGWLTVELALVALVLPQIIGAAVIFVRARSRSDAAHVGDQLVKEAIKLRALTVSVVSGLGGVLIVNLDSVYLIGVIGAEQLGYYAIAVLIAELFTAAAKPFRDAVFDGREITTRSMVGILKRAAVVLAIAAAVGALCIPWGVPLVFGKEFEPAVLACLVMVAGGYAKGLSYVVNGVLVRREEYSMRTWATWVGLALSIVAIFPLGYLGATGASIAKSIGYVSMLIIGSLGVRRAE